MKLLLHVCCTSCAMYPIDKAKKDNFTVTGFFYNPNIHPRLEHIKRRKEVEKYFSSEGLKLASPKYDPSCFFKNVMETVVTPRRCDNGSKRCRGCWGVRLQETAVFAKEKGFDAFTTTLLGSPYQDHMVLKDICVKLSEENNIDFYYEDFRIGFSHAHRLAKERGIYCQNYCGCIFSMVEREEARKKRLAYSIRKCII